MKVYTSVNEFIIDLELLSESKVISESKDVVKKNCAKYRTDKAKVLRIRHKMAKDPDLDITSIRDMDGTGITYETGKIVSIGKYFIDQNGYFSEGIEIYYRKKIPFYESISNQINKYTGKQVTWYDNGMKSSSYIWKDGELDGVCKEWDVEGNLTSAVTYENGKRMKVKKLKKN